MNADDLLTEFIATTGSSNPGFARDLLAGTNWNVLEAVNAYWMLGEPPLVAVDQSTQHAQASPLEQQDNADSPHAGAPRRAAVAATWQPSKKQDCVVDSGNTDTCCNPARRTATAAMDCSTAGVPTSRPDNQERHFMRALSSVDSNAMLLSGIRDNVVNDIKEEVLDSSESGSSSPILHFVEAPEYTFMLPNLQSFPRDFAAFVEKNLVDTTMLANLENAGRLNWWAPTCCKLLPHNTSGDGNCLLHAASLGMWGVHDRELILRKALYSTLRHEKKGDSLYRRWRWQQSQLNKQMDLVLSEEQWGREWSNLQNLASTRPKYINSNGNSRRLSRSNSTSSRSGRPVFTTSSIINSGEEVYYESLEEFHVFVLAHILRRPIIVVSDTVLRNSTGDALQPITFGGIFLPLESIPNDCHISPLLLAFDNSHFSPLVPTADYSSGSISESQSLAVVPLTDPDYSLLPVHFVFDPGQSFDWMRGGDGHFQDLSAEELTILLRKYLKIQYIPLCVNTHQGDAKGLILDTHGGYTDKHKPAKGAASSTKTLGSISRSMSKFKKNLSSSVKGAKNGDIPRKGSDDSLSDSSNKKGRGGATQAAAASCPLQECLLCAQLCIKTSPQYDELVANYLKSSRLAFERDAAASKVRPGQLLGEADCSAAALSVVKESRRLAAPGSAIGNAHNDKVAPSPPRTERKVIQLAATAEFMQDRPAARKCLSGDCVMYGTAANGYYCSKCYAKLKMSRAAPALPVEDDQLSQHQLPHTLAMSPQHTVLTTVPPSETGVRFPVADVRNTVTAHADSTVGGRAILCKQNSLYDNMLPSEGVLIQKQQIEAAGPSRHTQLYRSQLSYHEAMRSSENDNEAASPDRRLLLPQQFYVAGEDNDGFAMLNSGAASMRLGASPTLLSGNDNVAYWPDSLTRLPSITGFPSSHVPSTPTGSISSAKQPQQRLQQQQQPQQQQPQQQPQQQQQQQQLPVFQRSNSQTSTRSSEHPQVTAQLSLADRRLAPVTRHADVPYADRSRPGASFADPPAPHRPARTMLLYYSQREQQQQQAQVGPSDRCRLNGCKEPAAQKGLCKNCFKCAVAAKEHAQKYGRVMQQRIQYRT